MMPSVDRVGRYFPLMIGAVGAPPLLDWFHKHAAWYDAIEDLARASLDPGFRLAQFDQMPEPVLTDAAQAAPAGGVWRFALDEGLGERVAAVALQGHSLWWTDGSPGVEPSMLMCAGMPRAERFTAMLDAR
jgi:type VI secretion system protein ImpM